MYEVGLTDFARCSKSARARMRTDIYVYVALLTSNNLHIRLRRCVQARAHACIGKKECTGPGSLRVRGHRLASTVVRRATPRSLTSEGSCHTNVSRRTWPTGFAERVRQNKTRQSKEQKNSKTMSARRRRATRERGGYILVLCLQTRGSERIKRRGAPLKIKHHRRSGRMPP